MEPPELLACGPYRIHLGVRSGIAVWANEAMPFGDKRAFGVNNDGTDCGSAVLKGTPGGLDSQPHVLFVSPNLPTRMSRGALVPRELSEIWERLLEGSLQHAASVPPRGRARVWESPA